MAISGFQEIETDDGHQAIIYSTTTGGTQPIHGAIYFGDDYGWLPASWDTAGNRFNAERPNDLDITKAILNGQIQI